MSDNDDDLCIPRSAMYKLIKEIVPQVRLSGEAKDLIANACNEFIHLLATEANNVCEKQSKKLILPDHVLSALDNLGFSEYKEDCIEVMKQMQQEVDKRKKLRHKLDKPGIPEEELLRQQNQLFAEARQQQQMLETEEWTKVQMEAQLALQRQVSSNNTNSSNLMTSNFSNPMNGGASHFMTSGYALSPEGQLKQSISHENATAASIGASSNKNDDDDNYD